MVEEKKEFELPKTYDKCPVCGTEETLTTILREKLGNPRRPGEPELAVTIIPVPIASRAEILMGVPIPFADIYMNICANPDCGCMYPRRIDIETRSFQQG